MGLDHGLKSISIKAHTGFQGVLFPGLQFAMAHAGFRGDGIEGVRIYMTGLMGSDSGFTT
jgi:hypothetical protein